jgi:hypothetical protein
LINHRTLRRHGTARDVLACLLVRTPACVCTCVCTCTCTCTCVRVPVRARVCIKRVRACVCTCQVAAVSCGFSHSACLTTTGKIYAWGSGDEGQLGIGARQVSPAGTHRTTCVRHAYPNDTNARTSVRDLADSAGATALPCAAVANSAHQCCSTVRAACAVCVCAMRCTPERARWCAMEQLVRSDPAAIHPCSIMFIIES